jgi:hypothetical protein
MLLIILINYNLTQIVSLSYHDESSHVMVMAMYIEESDDSKLLGSKFEAKFI